MALGKSPSPSARPGPTNACVDRPRVLAGQRTSTTVLTGCPSGPPLASAAEIEAGVHGRLWPETEAPDRVRYFRSSRLTGRARPGPQIVEDDHCGPYPDRRRLCRISPADAKAVPRRKAGTGFCPSLVGPLDGMRVPTETTHVGGRTHRRHALPSGTATNFVVSPDFIRISTACLPSLCRSASS
jgi:hypothetical protein